ncbi:hypothetical protein Acor_64770 [Acrocarpospora corrugata]|uniref:Uncharacterized protein n=1 Tax=Acrocarpospora corrugata TaxID=35763 RepID=A0A5M3W7U0_9ACTN|nr:hypothetical protein [Acrocarpospora corrugata]GES04409.1 hypothetical protein Acor_64770 [Acrocarpospora corrugata]
MIDRYRRLFEWHQWLEDGLCWTMVQPLDDAVSGDDLLRRLNGGRDPERRVMAYPGEEALDEDRPVLFVFQGEGAWGFLEFTFGFATPDDILAELSRDARVWMATWHFKGGWTILHAAHGEIRARMRQFIFVEHAIEEGDPGILLGRWAEAHDEEIRDARARYDATAIRTASA